MLYTVPEALKKYNVARSGHLVAVHVTRLSQVHLGKTHSYYLDFRYKDMNRSIRVARNELEETTVGKSTSLRYLDQYPDLFLPPNETMRFELASQILLFVFSIYAIFYSITKLREPV